MVGGCGGGGGGSWFVALVGVASVAAGLDPDVDCSLALVSEPSEGTTGVGPVGATLMTDALMTDCGAVLMTEDNTVPPVR